MQFTLLSTVYTDRKDAPALSNPTIFDASGKPINVMPSEVNEYQELQKNIGVSAIFLCRSRGPLSGLMVEVKSLQADIQAMALTLAKTSIPGPDGSLVPMLNPQVYNQHVMHFMREAAAELQSYVTQAQQMILDQQKAVQAQEAATNEAPQSDNAPAPEQG